MKVLLAASECSPLVKVGGIADVIGSLPIALKNLSVDIRVVIPYYKPLKDCFDQNQTLCQTIKKIKAVQMPYGSKNIEIGLFQTVIPNTNIPVYLIQNDDYISNGGIYFSPGIMPSPEDELERFAVFSKAISFLFGTENDVFNPEIFHCNDWHTGIVPQVLHTTNRYTTNNHPIKTIFTIHNLAYQGFSKIEVAEKLGLDVKHNQLLRWDAEDNNLDFLMQGIISSSYITTVSKRYSEEIQTPQYGEGLDDILKTRKERLVGILNGISYEVFNPQTDKDIPARYAIANYEEQKLRNKQTLQQEIGLDENPAKPLIGVVSRLAQQKGLDIVADMIPTIINMGFQVVILGTGDPLLEAKFKELNQDEKYNKDYRAILQFSEPLARRIYAGSDAFLIPSRYEPSGLTQMIAMRYGSLPIVRATGGLFDTVTDEVTGFTFNNLTHQEVQDCLKRALNFYINNKVMWGKMVKTAMQQDFSWNESAKKYVLLYYKAIND